MNLLKIGEYNLNKTEFILDHFKQKRIKNSANIKQRFEYSCDECNLIYVTTVGNERNKEFPWICRSCRTKKYWAKTEYRNALIAGSNKESTKLLKSQNEKIRSLKMWADPVKKAEISLKLRNRDPSVYSKGRHKMRTSSKVLYWLTNEELICVGSYEAKFVNWCNVNKIEFDWQIPHKMPDGRTYIIDAFIKNGDYANTWIEIKGYMYKIGKEKWEWFNSNNKNSLLWTKPILKQMGIL